MLLVRAFVSRLLAAFPRGDVGDLVIVGEMLFLFGLLM